MTADALFCVKCNETGYSGESVCDCVAVGEAREFCENYLPGIFRGARWEDYAVSPAVLAQVRGATSAWLWGRAGSGKTLLAVCKLKEALWRRVKADISTKPVLFSRADEFFDDVQAARYGDGKFDFRRIRGGFFVLDDVDKRKPTDERADVLDSFFNFVWSEMVPGVITSNLSPTEFCRMFFQRQDYREAALSRILGHFTIIQTPFSEDWRSKKEAPDEK